MNSSRFDVYAHRVFTRSWNRSLGFIKHVAGFPYTGFATKRLSGEVVATTSCKSNPAAESSAR